MPSLTSCSSSLLTLSLLLVACDAPPDADDGQDRVQTYREAWNAANNPSLLDPAFNYTLAQLPTSGEAKRTPWAGSYWPTYKDSINDRWAGAGTQSPAKKYELAFARTGIENAVSEAVGIDSLAGKTCSADADCAATQGSVCAKRAGQTTGMCSETWFGICHAWAPAAILEEEPRAAVKYNGVEFKVNDLKALISLAYTEALDVKFLSLRCDQSGAATDLTGTAECKDTNAGSFHVVVANLLGVQGKAFVEDRTYDYEVWNQPVRGFKVTKNVAITAQQANQLLGAGKVLTTAAKSGTVANGAWQQVHTAAIKPGQTLRARMTGTGDADLYVRWNGQPTETTYHCRPYLDGTNEICEIVAPAATTAAYVAVKGFAPSSGYKLAIDVVDVAPAAYAFNPAAVSLRQVQTELSWIGESPQNVDGNLAGVISQYTNKDVYDYVLELDAAGKIIGGEWLGASKTSHPDFLWLPVQKHAATVAGVAWDDVKKLLALANGAPAPAPALLKDSATIAAGAWKHYAPIALTGTAKATLTLQSGDADLYVRKGSQPTATSYDCRPYVDGLGAEVCTLTGPGTFHVSLNGYAASSNYTIEVAAQ
jgi:hypothetical protein